MKLDMQTRAVESKKVTIEKLKQEKEDIEKDCKD
jgi:hypothetical protein